MKMMTAVEYFGKGITKWKGSNGVSRDGKMPPLKKEFCPLCKQYVEKSHKH